MKEKTLKNEKKKEGEEGRGKEGGSERKRVRRMRRNTHGMGLSAVH